MTNFNQAYRGGVTPITGGWSSEWRNVRTKFRNYSRAGDNLWIGITSNGVSGCRARWNQKYKHLGLNRMMPLYETSSDDFRKKMELRLTELMVDLDNVNNGGGGPAGSPPYIVYGCWRE
mmetsp:Transcript_23533/g.26104  ORF Transcript_23533/g.26104 Transcript_23533/m.26104 type:complete len:119 (+) Transcript_23533:44-400(+)